jgi:AraC-like DNA-binding protein
MPRIVSTIVPSRYGGDIGIRPLLAFPQILRELGADPAAILEQVGIGLDVFDDADSRVAFDALGRLLDEAATSLNCPHFGLLFAPHFELSGLGPVGYLMRNERSVGAALSSLVLHLHLHDRGAVGGIDRVDDHTVMLTYSIYHRNTPATDIIYDGSIAIAFRILRALCGPTWRPIAVHLARARPRNTRPYREYFGLQPRFDAPQSAVIFDASWMERPIEGADSTLHALLTDLIRGLEAREPTPLTEAVRRALRTMVMAGTASTDKLAHLFSLSERSLRRRLQAEGTGMHELLAETRIEIAQQLLQTELPLTEIAATLRYSEASAFSRAFRAWSGVTPREWRASARRRRRR